MKGKYREWKVGLTKEEERFLEKIDKIGESLKKYEEYESLKIRDFIEGMKYLSAASFIYAKKCQYGKIILTSATVMGLKIHLCDILDRWGKEAGGKISKLAEKTCSELEDIKDDFINKLEEYLVENCGCEEPID